MCTLGICVDGSCVFASWVEEIEFEGGLMSILIASATNEPAFTVLVLAGDGDVIARLSLQIDTLLPIHRHILDELEGICVSLITIRHVGSHLQGAVHGDIERELASQGAVDEPRPFHPLIDLRFQYARCVVHRSTLQTGERQDGGVVGVVAAKGFVLSALGALVANQVGIGAAKSGGSHRLMRIDHDMLLGGFLHAIEIVIHHPLTIMVFAARYDVAHITTLDRIVAMINHKLVSTVEMSLIVAHRRRCLMVHHQSHALGVCIVVERISIEVGIWSDKVEDLILGIVGPVFPSDVPSLDQHLVEAIGSGEVDIASNGVVVGSVCAIGCGMQIVR